MPRWILGLALLASCLGHTPVCKGVLVGNNFEIAPAGRFPDLAYGNGSRHFADSVVARNHGSNAGWRKANHHHERVRW